MAKRVKGDSYYGRVAKFYQRRREKQGWWPTEQAQMRSILETLPRDLSVLDAPFGTGRFVKTYLEFGYDVTGLEISNEMIAQSRVELGEDFDRCNVVEADARKIPFEDGAFDLVVSVRFLRDIVTLSDARLILAEFARVCRRFAVIQLGECVSETSAPGEDEAMGSRFTADQIDALLTEHGFAVVSRHLVKDDPEDNSRIHHILCERDGQTH